jgi:hypothetical protein
LAGDSVVAHVDGDTGTVKWYAVSSSVSLIRTDSLRQHGRDVTEDEVRASISGAARSLPAGFSMSMPPTHTTIATDARFSSDGSLWVAKPARLTTGTGVTLDDGTMTTWTVFPPQATPYTVDLPGRYSVFAIRGDKVFGFIRISDAKYFVTVYQVAAP